MTIAGRIIEIVGGPEKVSEIAGVHISQVYRWTWPKSRGGTDGRVPTQHQQPILNYAIENKLPLTPADFFDPIDEPESSGDLPDCHGVNVKPALRSPQRESVPANHSKRAGASA
jgi:hypothetical protein